MDIVVRGKNVEVTSALRDHVTRKLSKLNRFLEHQSVVATAVLSVEKDRQIIEVTVPLDGGMLLRGEESTPDMYGSVDRVVDKLERQFTKFKTRMHRYHGGHGSSVPRLEATEEEVSVSDLVRKKTFPRKPMTLEEALMQMDLLGHDFFVFANAESGSTNVLYRRRDGRYGLLEPR
jgi:putative sigma-54 modulation protein